MKRYNVECIYRGEEMIQNDEYRAIWSNYVGDYITADSPEEAIEIAIDCLVEMIDAPGGRVESDEDTIRVYDIDDKMIEEYYDFRATCY